MRPSNEGLVSMQTARTLVELRAMVNGWRKAGQRVALVPTMGALHAGHLRLITEARRQADRVVVSIFVNPAQFGPNEDFIRYPRQEQADAALIAEAKCDALWLPDVAVMYPKGFATKVSVSGVSEGLCGAERPGHFDGVATVVCKLFNQTMPHVAYFGEKDYQQLTVIRRMTKDLDIDVEVVGVPTVREDDGLALSSRNVYLSPDERARAATLPRAIKEAGVAVESGADIASALEGVREALMRAGFAVPDYVELRDAETLAPVTKLTKRPARLLVAARLGQTRLIDNWPVGPAGK